MDNHRFFTVLGNFYLLFKDGYLNVYRGIGQFIESAFSDCKQLRRFCYSG